MLDGPVSSSHSAAQTGVFLGVQRNPWEYLLGDGNGGHGATDGYYSQECAPGKALRWWRALPVGEAELLRVIDGYTGGLVTCCALKLAPLVFVRPGELRRAEWTEFNLDRAEWRIPASKMKMRDEHIVQLSEQAVAILREIQPLTGRGRFVFPGERSLAQPMSNNTVNAALRRLGFDKNTMTGHGFRAMTSTRLNELGWTPDVIERQLAHAERNKVRAAYNRAQYLAERRKMMQTWADYLDDLRMERKVVSMRRTGT